MVALDDACRASLRSSHRTNVGISKARRNVTGSSHHCLTACAYFLAVLLMVRRIGTTKSGDPEVVFISENMTMRIGSALAQLRLTPFQASPATTNPLQSRPRAQPPTSSERDHFATLFLLRAHSCYTVNAVTGFLFLLLCSYCSVPGASPFLGYSAREI